MPIERRGADLMLNGERVTTELESLLESEDARIRELVGKSTAAATKRAYASDWDSFCGWCLGRGFTPLPALPDVVARYMRWLIDRPVEMIEESYTLPGKEKPGIRRRRQGKATPATVRRHLVSIRKAHRAADVIDPTASLLVTTVWSGIRRERGRPPRQKAQIDSEMLVRALSAHAESIQEALTANVALSSRKSLLLHAARDRAIILLGWSGAFRRSELAAIEFEHLRFDERGVEIVLPRSKRNQEGQLESVLIGFAINTEVCPIGALREWIALMPDVSGFVFRRIDQHGNVFEQMQPRVVADVTKAFAAAAGFDPKEFGGHSLRSGWITTAAKNDRHERDIMRHSRHKSIPVMRGYIREATKWVNHPGLGLL
jgi:integrase